MELKTIPHTLQEQTEVQAAEALVLLELLKQQHQQLEQQVKAMMEDQDSTFLEPGHEAEEAEALVLLVGMQQMVQEVLEVTEFLFL